MANVIDLCTTNDVRVFAGHLLTEPKDQDLVDTTVAGSILAGVRTVAPTVMDSIKVGTLLQIDDGAAAELVIVTAITDTTFTAEFAKDHVGPFSVTDSANIQEVMLGRLVTAASAYIMWRTGNAADDGSVPTASPFTSTVSYNEWYDGNNNDRLYLRHFPIRTVTALTINGAAIPASTGWGVSGYNIDDSKKCLVFSGSTVNVGRNLFLTVGGGRYFTRGTRNINVQYTAGYTAIPYDLRTACAELVAFNFRRRDWLGMRMVTQPQSEGTITYETTWVTPPSVEEVLSNYIRRSY